jgi:uncharacterized protein YecA (UPF0149 family)
MNVDNGKLYENSKEILEAMERQERLAPLSESQFRHARTLDPANRKNWMRNQPCPCGSGKKFKRCHWHKTEELISESN